MTPQSPSTMQKEQNFPRPLWETREHLKRSRERGRGGDASAGEIGILQHLTYDEIQ